MFIAYVSRLKSAATLGSVTLAFVLAGACMPDSGAGGMTGIAGTNGGDGRGGTGAQGSRPDAAGSGQGGTNAGAAGTAVLSGVGATGGVSGGGNAAGSAEKGGTTGSAGTSGASGMSGRGGSTAGAGASTPDGGSPDGRTGPPPDFTVARSTFSPCRFHFGTIDSKARSAGSALITQLDYFTPGWMLNASFDHSSVCTEVNSGGALAGKIPVVVGYVAAGIAKRDHSLCDCNVSGCSGGDLCKYGAQYIRQDWTKILNGYRSYSQGYASCYGTSKPIIFEMEPDWYQYTGTSQTQPWTAAQAGQYMAELVAALRTNLPNARFSMDVSPWVAPNNGSDNGRSWYSNFDLSLFTFVNTSGGGTSAGTAKIRNDNTMTWGGLFQVTGKPILADTGYGANGASAGHDTAWDSVTNINARIADGVTAIAQYNPSGSWSSTISGIRGQLSIPPYCQ